MKELALSMAMMAAMGDGIGMGGGRIKEPCKEEYKVHLPKNEYKRRQKRMRMQKESRKINRAA
jgi:hypothetical protein